MVFDAFRFRNFFKNFNFVYFLCFDKFFLSTFISESEMVEVEVEFDYEAELSDELTIKAGEIIKEVKKMDGGWWEGTLNGRRGVFPDNFVKVRLRL